MRDTPNADPRRLLVDGVGAATLMQVATIGDGGAPVICQVWFAPGFEPDRLYFVSREDREHAINLRNDPRVAASIALEVPAGLGERVRGVSLTGLARQIPDAELPQTAAAFVARWPRAAEVLQPGTRSAASPSSAPGVPGTRSAAPPSRAPGVAGDPGTPGAPAAHPTAPPVPRPARPALTPKTRLYEIAVVRWVLFDEVNFPAQPRLTVPAR